MAQPIRQPERVDFIAAEQDVVGKSGPTEEHTEDGSFRSAVGQRNQLARHNMRTHVLRDDLQYLLQRRNRMTDRAKVERNQIGLAVREHGDRWRNRADFAAIMAALIEFSERGLHRAVAAVDHQHSGLHPGNGAKRHRHFRHILHLIVEDIGMGGDKVPHARQHRPIAGRTRIGQQRDQGHGVPISGRRQSAGSTDPSDSSSPHQQP